LKDNEYKEALDAYTIIRSYETDNKFTEDEIGDLYINKYNKDLNII
jgi:hypothetical protein